MHQRRMFSNIATGYRRACTIALLLIASPAAAQQMDFTPRPLQRLKPGVLSLSALPDGYSHVVMLAWPRLTKEAQASTPGTAAKFAQMFGSVLLADVRRVPAEGGKYRLQRLAIGHILRKDNQLKIVTPDSQELTYLAAQVLSSGEKELDKIQQIARYDTALLFETPAVILRGQRHQPMALRQFIWTSAKQGGLGSALWLIDRSQPAAPRVADSYFVQLPQGFRDDRLLSVDPSQFNFVGMPGKTAFAMARLPQGEQIPFTPALARLAAAPSYTAQTLPLLARELSQAIAAKRQANPVSSR